MEQSDNKSFDSIISGEFDSPLSRSFEMFDRYTNEFYTKFDVLIDEINQTGQFEHNASLSQVGVSFELVINEIMEQDYDIDTKLAEISGVVVADTVRRDQHLASKMNVLSADQDTIDAVREVYSTMVHEMHEDGVDIPRVLSTEYIKFIETELSNVILDLVIRHHRDKKDS